jgi:hypothetical protein
MLVYRLGAAAVIEELSKRQQKEASEGENKARIGRVPILATRLCEW